VVARIAATMIIKAMPNVDGRGFLRNMSGSPFGAAPKVSGLTGSVAARSPGQVADTSRTVGATPAP
jgi:hypothetical protein